jgi:hypothetical protein
MKKTFCKDCAAAEPDFLGDDLVGYWCHRYSGTPDNVDGDHWCFDGVPEEDKE